MAVKFALRKSIAFARSCVHRRYSVMYRKSSIVNGSWSVEEFASRPLLSDNLSLQETSCWRASNKEFQRVITGLFNATPRYIFNASFFLGERKLFHKESHLAITISWVSERSKDREMALAVVVVAMRFSVWLAHRKCASGNSSSHSLPKSSSTSAGSPVENSLSTISSAASSFCVLVDGIPEN